MASYLRMNLHMVTRKPPQSLRRMGVVFLLLFADWALGSDAAQTQRRRLSGPHTHSSSWPGPYSLPHISDSLQRVAIVNPYSFCWEIVFGLTYAFQAIAHTVDVFAQTKDPGALGSIQTTSADAVIHTFHNRPVQDIGQLPEDSHNYDLIVYADWYAPESFGPPDTSLRAVLDYGYTGRIWIFNHEPWYLFWAYLENSTKADEVKAKPDYRRHSWEIWTLPQVEWFAIAPHVSWTTQHYFNLMGIKKTIRWVCPVAPGNLRAPMHSSWHAPELEGKHGFAIQGAHSRRNYTGLFNQLVPRPDIYKDKRFQLQTYTWNELDKNLVPEELRPTIVGKKHLNFPDFYGNMSQNIALLTLFDTHRYFHEAASSTIIVAMSTATPLIVEPGFLEVYTFVDAGAVIVAENGDYATALDKILHMSPEHWGNLAMEMTVSREANVLRNLQVFARLFEQTSPGVAKQ